MGDSRVDEGDKRHFTLRSFFCLNGYFSLIAAALLLSAGALLAALGYNMMTHMLETTVERRADAIGRDIKRNILNGIRRPARNFLAAFSQSALVRARTPEERVRFLSLIREVLGSNVVFSGIIVSYDNGDVFMSKLLETEQERGFFDAPPETDLLVVEIEGSGKPPGSTYFFYDSSLQLLSSRKDSSGLLFLAKAQARHRAAAQTAEIVKTNPQIIFSRRNASMYMVQKSRDGRAAVALSIRLDHLSNLLAVERPTPGSRLGLFQADNHPFALDQGLLNEKNGQLTLRTLDDLPPAVRLGVEKYRQGLRTNNRRVENGAESAGLRVHDGERDWILFLEELDNDQARPGNFMVLAIPWDEIFVSAGLFLRYAMLGMLGLSLLIVPMVWLVARHVSAPLRLMTERTRNLNEIPGEGMNTMLSLVPEINGLMRNVGFMRENQRKILSIIGLICGDRDFETLPGRVLRKIMTITGADGGVLLITNGSKDSLETGWFCWDDGAVRDVVMPGPLPRTSYAICRALAEGRSVSDRITRDDPRAGVEPIASGFAGHPELYWMNLTSLPLRDRTGEPLGALTLLKRGEAGDTELSAEQTTFMETLTAAAAVVLETQALIKSQYDLRDALIRILAGAIDTKSPYTGGHCARVPVIFQMLLEAAHETKDGPLRDFHLDEDGREEARLAAWLHDCGKVTTPEYVMDKATKLETLYNRIHEIRTRFEVLKRDAEIACLKARLEGADAADEQGKLAKALAELDEEFAFVSSCNIGGEYVNDADLERLAAIGGRTWVRTLDKRLGCSRDEVARMEDAGVPDPPFQETLLMDSPAHIIPRGEKDKLPADNPWGFRLEVPAALYNRGELYNLSIRRGTLTAEERYKINDHITRTIIMLEELPLPKHLRRVPEIAGAHHETMDGWGYPRGLKREEMSWEARMMAIADIFEALTAWDRPYKSSKTLREALEIMEVFKKNNHIDPHLFEIFLAADIPGRYAAEYLKPEQNDLK